MLLRFGYFLLRELVFFKDLGTRLGLESSFGIGKGVGTGLTFYLVRSILLLLLY